MILVVEDDPYGQSALLEHRFGCVVRSTLYIPFVSGVLTLTRARAPELDVEFW